MAKYDISYRCGHTNVVNLIGQYKYREKFIEDSKNLLCRDCYRVKMQKEREQEWEKARLDASEHGYPELEGSPKQINWAMCIRKEKMAQLQEAKFWISKQYHETVDIYMALVTLEEIRDKNHAAWWIDRRQWRLVDILDRIMKAKIKEKQLNGTRV